MTIAELREKLKDIPDDALVLLENERSLMYFTVRSVVLHYASEDYAGAYFILPHIEDAEDPSKWKKAVVIE